MSFHGGLSRIGGRDRIGRDDEVKQDVFWFGCIFTTIIDIELLVWSDPKDREKIAKALFERHIREFQVFLNPLLRNFKLESHQPNLIIALNSSLKSLKLVSPFGMLQFSIPLKLFHHEAQYLIPLSSLFGFWARYFGYLLIMNF